MKLSYVSGSIIPSDKANAVHVMKMCQAFARQKDMDVMLLAKRGKEKSDPYKFYDVKDNFRLERSWFGTVPLLSGVFRILVLLAKVGLIPTPQTLYGRDAFGLLFLSLSGLPVFFEAHQVPTSAIQKSIWSGLFKRKNLKGIVVISEGLKQDMIKAFPEYKGKYLIAHDGADIVSRGQKKIPAKDWPARKNAIQIGYAGSLHKGKGMELITKIAPLLPEMDFHVLGGDGKSIEKWKTADIAPNIHFHGHQPHEKMPAYLMAMDIALAPYQNDIRIKTGEDISRWISPLKLFEYMAARRAIVCSDIPVLREIITQGRNGYLADPEDVNAWVEAITQLAKSPALRNAIGLEGEKDILDIYSWNKRAEKILDFIRIQVSAN